MTFDSVQSCVICRTLCCFLFRRGGRVGFSFGGGGNSGVTKIVLTLDDLVFINTQISKRVSSMLNL